MGRRIEIRSEWKRVESGYFFCRPDSYSPTICFNGNWDHEQWCSNWFSVDLSDHIGIAINEFAFVRIQLYGRHHLVQAIPHWTISSDVEDLTTSENTFLSWYHPGKFVRS